MFLIYPSCWIRSIIFKWDNYCTLEGKDRVKNSYTAEWLFSERLNGQQLINCKVKANLNPILLQKRMIPFQMTQKPRRFKRKLSHNSACAIEWQLSSQGKDIAAMWKNCNGKRDSTINLCLRNNIFYAKNVNIQFRFRLKTVRL